MRVCYQVTAFPTLSETFVLNQITGLLDRGADVHIVARRAGQSQHHPDVDRYRLLERCTTWPAVPASKPTRLRNLPRLLAGLDADRRRRLLNTIRPRFGTRGLGLELAHAARPFLLQPQPFDAVHCHFAPNGVVAAMLRHAGVLHNAAVAVTFHDYGLTTYLDKWGPRVYQHLFQHADRIFAITHQCRDRLIQLGAPERLVTVHRMGVDLARFPPRTGPVLNPDPHAPLRLFSVGRLVEKKGHTVALEALARLRDEHHVDARYVVAGDGPLRQDLEAAARRLRLEDRVQLLGAVPQNRVADELEACDAFLCPSVTAADGDAEGLPVAIMEAMARRVPVIATDHAAIPELVRHDDTGLLVPERDPHALAAAVARLRAEPDLAERLAHAGREAVHQSFNLASLNDALLEELRELAAARAKP